jgi:hypothetical protein
MNIVKLLSFEDFVIHSMRNSVIVLLFLSTTCFGQMKLSEDATISLVTCGPGQGELYSAFGHSAFRVNDPSTGFDAIYNYGVFNFNQKNFYLNFARGYLYYKLGVHRYEDFEYFYITENRFMHEQHLNLNQYQKQKLFDYLTWNALPENQHYRYDYFYNNCATKLRDVVKIVFKDSVRFDSTHIKTDYTIRELTDLYLQYQPWGDLGIDIGLGLPMDKKASAQEYMFLPDYLETGFDHATILTDSTSVPLVADKFISYEQRPENFSAGLFQPLYVFTLFLLLVCWVSYRDLKRKKITMVLDTVLFTVFGVLGLLLLLLWTATDHNAAAKNFNLLWALPTHLIAIVAFFRQPQWLKKYFLAVLIISVLLLLSWAALPQMLHYSLIPLVMAISVRSFVQYKLRL